MVISQPTMKKILRPLAITVAVAGCTAFLALWYVTRLNPAQQTVANTLQLVDAIADPAVGHGRTLSTTLEFLRAKGLPDNLIGARLELRFAAPDKLRLSTRVGKEVIELGRSGDQVWVSQPAKNFAVQAMRG